jgi:hypothetical protein
MLRKIKTKINWGEEARNASTVWLKNLPFSGGTRKLLEHPGQLKY